MSLFQHATPPGFFAFPQGEPCTILVIGFNRIWVVKMLVARNRVNRYLCSCFSSRSLRVVSKDLVDFESSLFLL